MIEEVDYNVTIIIRLSTTIGFSAMERDRPITKFDAIDNALGHFQDDMLKEIESGFGGEFEVDFDYETERL